MASKRVVFTGEVKLVLDDNLCYEKLISQLQPYIKDAILAVKNGTELKIFRERKDFPPLIRFEREHQGELYSFRDGVDDSLYVLFGREAASILYPHLTEDKRVAVTINQNGIITSSIASSSVRGIVSSKTMDI